MSKAWGHNVRLLTDDEIAHQMHMANSSYQFDIDHPKEGRIPNLDKCIHYQRKCRISAKCQNLSTQMLTYRYVTGRAGRTSYAEKPICDHHAKKYIQP